MIAFFLEYPYMIILPLGTLRFLTGDMGGFILSATLLTGAIGLFCLRRKHT